MALTLTWIPITHQVLYLIKLFILLMILLEIL